MLATLLRRLWPENSRQRKARWKRAKERELRAQGFSRAEAKRILSTVLRT